MIFLLLFYFNKSFCICSCISTISAYQRTYVCYLNYHATVCDGVPWLPLREQVFSAQEGNPASTYLPISPLLQSCGISVGTLCGTLTFGWYLVRYLDLRLTPRVSTLNSHDWPHLEGTRLESYRLSHLTTHSPMSSTYTHTHPGQPRWVVSD